MLISSSSGQDAAPRQDPTTARVVHIDPGIDYQGGLMAETKTSEKTQPQASPQSGAPQSGAPQGGTAQGGAAQGGAGRGESQRTGGQQGESPRTGGGQQSGERSLQSRNAGRGGLPRRQGYPSLFAVSPFELMRRMSEEMIRTIAGVPAGGEAQQLWAPRIEARQEGGEFLIRAELPGTDAGDITVDVSDDAVTIHGERRQEHEERRGDLIVSEISYGEFHRVIPLPEGVIADSAKANFREGVLEIRMPAPPAEVRQGRRLEIGRESKGTSQSLQPGQQQPAQTQGQPQGQTAQK
jgi:HSP20 family protein